jgi:5,10-methylenetetrahydrofolate reductase
MLLNSIHNLSSFNDRFPLLFEIVPPEKENKEERLIQHTRLLETLFNTIDVDALNIPEIQDESRKGEKGKRLSRFRERVSPRIYARKLAENFDTDFIINRVIVKDHHNELEKWMIETYEEFGIPNIILVGGESSRIKYNGPSVVSGNKMVTRYLNQGRFRYNSGKTVSTNYNVGNICIPTRRKEVYDEPERMLHKIKSGADFFTSQIIAEAKTPISLMNDLSELLINEKEEPPVIFWSFSPISCQTDVNFLRWLGVHIPEKTEKFILEHNNPASISAEVFLQIWEKMLDFNSRLPVTFPMGINISIMGLRNFENGILLARELNMAVVHD